MINLDFGTLLMFLSIMERSFLSSTIICHVIYFLNYTLRFKISHSYLIYIKKFKHTLVTPHRQFYTNSILHIPEPFFSFE